MRGNIRVFCRVRPPKPSTAGTLPTPMTDSTLDDHSLLVLTIFGLPAFSCIDSTFLCAAGALPPAVTQSSCSEVSLRSSPGATPKTFELDNVFGPTSTQVTQHQAASLSVKKSILGVSWDTEGSALAEYGSCVD